MSLHIAQQNALVPLVVVKERANFYFIFVMNYHWDQKLYEFVNSKIFCVYIHHTIYFCYLYYLILLT